MLSLCDRSGVAVAPWVAAGFQAVIVDVQHEGDTTDGAVRRIGRDVRLLELDDLGGPFVFGFGFPPCTHFAGSGARWWAGKGDVPLIESLSIADACLRILRATCDSWAIENPVGRLTRFWGSFDHSFNPCDFGGYKGGEGDAYTKRTCLWTGGGYQHPAPKPIEPTEGSRMHLVPPGPERQNIRSETPRGWAQATFEANARLDLFGRADLRHA